MHFWVDFDKYLWPIRRWIVSVEARALPRRRTANFATKYWCHIESPPKRTSWSKVSGKMELLGGWNGLTPSRILPLPLGLRRGGGDPAKFEKRWRLQYVSGPGSLPGIPDELSYTNVPLNGVDRFAADTNYRFLAGDFGDVCCIKWVDQRRKAHNIKRTTDPDSTPRAFQLTLMDDWNWGCLIQLLGM